MAQDNSIKPPNFTQIPNVIFDHWMAILKPSEFLVLCCLCRKIFGWHKSSDRISKNRLCKATGLSKNSVQSAIEGLEGHGLVCRQRHSDEYGNRPNTYSLNITKPKDNLYCDQDLDGDGSEDDLGVDQDLTQDMGQDLTPQKKDSSKERPLKEKEESASPISSGSLKNSSKRQKTEPAPKIERFKNIFTTDLEHKNIVDEFEIQGATRGYKEYGTWKDKKGISGGDDYLAVLKWLRKDKPAKIVPMENKPEEASVFQKVSANILLKYPKQARDGHINVGSDYIEFVRGINSDYIREGDNNPIGQIESVLRKMNLPVDWIKEIQKVNV